MQFHANNKPNCTVAYSVDPIGRTYVNTMTDYHSYVLIETRHNGIIEDSTLYFSNGTSVGQTVQLGQRINCSNDLNDHSLIDSYTIVQTKLSIDTVKEDNGKFSLNEIHFQVQIDTACGSRREYPNRRSLLWRCGFNKKGLLETMELVGSEGMGMMNSDAKLTMLIKFSNKRTGDFGKYIPELTAK